MHSAVDAKFLSKIGVFYIPHGLEDRILKKPSKPVNCAFSTVTKLVKIIAV